MLGLEALTGSLEDFGFEDYLNGNYFYLLTTKKVIFNLVVFDYCYKSCLFILSWLDFEFTLYFHFNKVFEKIMILIHNDQR
jgi:hypothetical protein